MTRIEVKVKPNARQSSIEKLEDGTWLARTKSPPVDGRANRELVELVAHHFGVGKSRVSLRSGASGRRKRLEIDV